MQGGFFVVHMVATTIWVSKNRCLTLKAFRIDEVWSMRFADYNAIERFRQPSCSKRRQTASMFVRLEVYSEICRVQKVQKDCRKIGGWML